ncbi:MAG: hypothetical protein HYV07_09220 [Deltaproteobacteria bacterium]|nr:hypothetical protein [Deltaproteobacteria bacterium]
MTSAGSSRGARLELSRILASGALLSALGCPESVGVFWPDVSDSSFLVMVEDGRPTAIFGPRGVAPEPIEIPEGASVTRIDLSPPPRGRSRPHGDRASFEDPSSLRLSLDRDAACSALGKRGVDPTRVRVPLTRSGAAVLAFKLESGQWAPAGLPAWVEEVDLELPYFDGGTCLERPGRLGRFSPAEPFPDGIEVDGQARFRDGGAESWRYFSPTAVVQLTHDLVLVATPHLLYLLSRGRPFEDDGRHVIDPRTHGVELGPDWHIRDLDLDSGHDPFRLLMSWARAAESGGALVELELTPEGQPISSRTATVTVQRVSQSAVARDGTFVSVGEGGLVLTGSMGGTLEAHVLDEARSFRLVVDGGWPARPFVAAGVPVLEIWPGTDSPLHVLASQPPPSTSKSLAVSATPGALDLWVGSYAPALHRFDAAAGWRTLDVPLPDSVAGCAGGTSRCGWSLLNGEVGPIAALPDGRVGLAVEGCSALLVLGGPDESPCVDVLAEPELGVVRSTDAPFSKLGAGASGQPVWLGGTMVVLELAEGE